MEPDSYFRQPSSAGSARAERSRGTYFISLRSGERVPFEE